MQISRSNPKDSFVPVGRAWKNVGKSGKNAGIEYLNLTIDKSVDQLVLSGADALQLWPNEKRPGHEATDADYRVVAVAQAPVAAA